VASYEAWLEIFAGIKAVFDTTTNAADVQEAYDQHRREPDTQAEARRASKTLSTYSDEEFEAIKKRLKACRNQFIKEGRGAERAQCLCRVFDEMMEGNGGVLPRYDGWERIYRQLCSEKLVR
jgi:hypothetical protein